MVFLEILEIISIIIIVAILGLIIYVVLFSKNDKSGKKVLVFILFVGILLVGSLNVLYAEAILKPHLRHKFINEIKNSSYIVLKAPSLVRACSSYHIIKPNSELTIL